MRDTILTTLSTAIYRSCIQPKSIGVDSRRQEYILNTLLVVMACVSSIVVVISFYYMTRQRVTHHVSSLISTAIFCSLIYGLLWLSRSGRHKSSTYIFIGLLGLSGMQMLWIYSFEIPQALLVFAMTIVITSVLISARAGLVFTAVLAILLATIGYCQLTNRLQPDTQWFEKDFNMGDVLSYSFVLAVIGIVSWLSNREIDRSLQRARQSEASLALERDKLEIRVIERTRELEQTQLLRTIELQRFAEFGRLSATLLHELANPLMAASLHLQHSKGENATAMRRARQNLRQIERYVISARKQLQHHTSRKRFSVHAELTHIANLLLPLARSYQIDLIISQSDTYWLYGDAVKFNQLISNLIVNAIDASKHLRTTKNKRITVDVTATEAFVVVTVQDWGIGIKPELLKHIFEPFYTTKSDQGRGLGIGLSLVKAFVEDEFGGTIIAHSAEQTGTVFTVKLQRSN